MYTQVRGHGAADRLHPFVAHEGPALQLLGLLLLLPAGLHDLLQAGARPQDEDPHRRPRLLDGADDLRGGGGGGGPRGRPERPRSLRAGRGLEPGGPAALRVREGRALRGAPGDLDEGRDAGRVRGAEGAGGQVPVPAVQDLRAQGHALHNRALLYEHILLYDSILKLLLLLTCIISCYYVYDQYQVILKLLTTGTRPTSSPTSTSPAWNRTRGTGCGAASPCCVCWTSDRQAKVRVRPFFLYDIFQTEILEESGQQNYFLGILINSMTLQRTPCY